VSEMSPKALVLLRVLGSRIPVLKHKVSTILDSYVVVSDKIQ